MELEAKDQESLNQAGQELKRRRSSVRSIHGEEWEQPGPVRKRGVTDCLCMVIFLAYSACFPAAAWWLRSRSDVYHLTHGTDHYGEICGRNNQDLDLGYAFFPDLNTDLALDQNVGFFNYYGICVEACPEQNTVVYDYPRRPGSTGGEEMRRSSWFVSLPSFPLAGRCIPYEPGPLFSKTAMEFCADPQCNATDSMAFPGTHQENCGLSRDGTDKYWLLTEPDDQVLEGWQTQGLSEANIEFRTELAKTADETQCRIPVLRDTRIRLIDPIFESVYLRTFTQLTGFAVRLGVALYTQLFPIIFLGLFCSLVAALLVVTFFTLCVQVVLVGLIVTLFGALCVADYVLFIQAGLVSNDVGLSVLGIFEDATNTSLPDAFSNDVLVQAEAERIRRIYTVAAFVVLVLIFVYVCVVCAMRHNFRLMIALFQQSTAVIKQLPSLMVFPLFLLGAVFLTMMLLGYVFIGYLTLEQAELENIVATWNTLAPTSWDIDTEEELENFYEGIIWVLVASFIWFYYFYVAIFRLVTSLGVSTWYFYRNDPDNSAGTGWYADVAPCWYPGKPAVLACSRVFAHHLGSAAMGSFIMTLATMPRIIFEYVQSRTGGAEQSNPMMVAIIRCARCCLWCVEKCVHFLTEYAYVYVAVTGNNFCKSARSSFGLIAKYPGQVAIDKAMSLALSYLACATIPLLMGILSYWYSSSEPLVVAILIMVLSYIVTRFAVGVYDICVTTLFVCVMRDVDKYGGIYMPDPLAEALGVTTEIENAKDGEKEEEGKTVKDVVESKIM